MQKNNQTSVETKENVETKKDVETKTNVENKERQAVSTTKIRLLDDKSSFVITEAFRNIMSNVSFAVPKKEDGSAKIIVISSALVGEGKSTVAANLALTFATAGTKTLLIDCDMRKPRIKAIFSLPQGVGIVGYLSGGIEFDSILQKEVRPNLDVIATYKTAPNPLALLTSTAFTDLLDKLKNDYEYIIIDTPPITVVSDALMIAPHSDGVVLVVRPEVSNHKDIQQAINSILFSESNFLGFILNDENRHAHGRKYYSKYYKKYYKYGYGYGDKKSSK